LAYFVRRYSDGDEIAIEALLKETFRSFQQKNYWVWKYKSNPNFDPSLVALAEKDGKLIGCNHWLIREIKLSKEVRMKAVLAGDITVDRAYRGQGIGKELITYLHSSDTLKKKGVILSYMFTNPKLNNVLFQPTAGYVLFPTCSITYKKFFDCRQLKQKIEQINSVISTKEGVKTKLAAVVMTVSFELKGIPKFTLSIERDGLHLSEDKSEDKPEKPDVIIEGSLPISLSLVDGRIGTKELMIYWISGRIKIKKGLLKILRMRKAFKIIQNGLKNPIESCP
jgi:predicted N-acetyltransferase YhbS